MRREARKALDQIGINIPRIDVPVARLSGGQRQAIAVARTISGDADIILLDEPLAAMGAKEGAMILDLIARLKAEGNVSIIMILHNYVHVLAACDRVNLIQDGVIALDNPTAETSVDELTEIVVEEYRRARQAAIAEARVGPRPRTPTPAARETVGLSRSVAEPAYTIGVDFGTESGRALLLDVRSGEELGVQVHAYASGVIDAELPSTGEALPHDWALQDPDDWVAVLSTAVPALLRETGVAPSAVVGLGIDFTSCTVLPVGSDGEPLCRAERWRTGATRGPSCGSITPPSRSPTASTTVAQERGEAFLARYGGRISSEWYFPKLIEIWLEDRELLRRDGRVPGGHRLDRLAAHRPRVPPELHGRVQGDVVARRRAALARVLRGGLPGLRAIRPPSSAPSSPRWAPGRERLTAECAARLGLTEQTAVAVGNVDSFVSVPGRGRRAPGRVRQRDRHLDLRHGPRRTGGPPARHHRRGARRHPARPVGL